MKREIRAGRIKKELSDKAKLRLSRWYLKKEGKDPDPLIHPWKKDKAIVGMVLPYWLTIGDMIEFLDENCGETLKAWSSNKQCLTRDIMPVGYFSGLEIVIDPNIEICDALWQAVKEVLER